MSATPIVAEAEAPDEARIIPESIARDPDLVRAFIVGWVKAFLWQHDQGHPVYWEHLRALLAEYEETR